MSGGEDTATAEPPPAKVLLLHGFFSGPVAWDRIRTDLHDHGVETIAPDHLGYGKYRRVRSSAYTAHALAEHLAPLVERERPTHVVGHSMGGIVALELNRLLGGHAFKRAGLVGLPVFANAEEGIAYQASRGLKFKIYMRTHGFSHVGCEVLNRSRFAWSRFAGLYAPAQPLELLATVFDHNYESHYHGLRSIALGGLVPELARETSIDVALLHGTRDRAAPIDRARDVARAAGWHFDAITGANHQVIVERPLAVSNWILRTILPGSQVEESAARVAR